MQRVAAAAEEAGAATERTGFRFGAASSALRGLNLTLLSATRIAAFFGIQNEALTRSVDGLITGLTIARAALALYKAASASVTLQNWARAASEVAASAWAAPILIAIIAAAVIGLYGMIEHFTAASMGIDTMVTGPRVFLAGEGGPERVRIEPMGGGGGTGGPVYVTNYIYTMDPDAAARAVNDSVIRLKQAGR